eukprot:361077-Chlamydomonas_euryale.AAC.6
MPTTWSQHVIHAAPVDATCASAASGGGHTCFLLRKCAANSTSAAPAASLDSPPAGRWPGQSEFAVAAAIAQSPLQHMRVLCGARNARGGARRMEACGALFGDCGRLCERVNVVKCLFDLHHRLPTAATCTARQLLGRGAGRVLSGRLDRVSSTVLGRVSHRQRAGGLYGNRARRSALAP